MLFASCSKDSPKTDTKQDSSLESRTVRYANTATKRIIDSYGISKIAQLAQDYNQGFVLFVLTETDISPTKDPSNLSDFLIDWSLFQVNDYTNDTSGSWAKIHPGMITYKPDDSQIELEDFDLSLQAGQVVELKSTDEQKFRLYCEVFLSDDDGSLCALGISGSK